MNKLKYLAEKLNGRQYGNEITKEDILFAKENNLLIIVGASDDLVEFYGYYEDEGGCYNGGIVTFDKYGVSQDSDNIRENKLNCLWCKKIIDEKRVCWSYSIDIPYETFLIYEDDDIYCEGIVISVEDLK